MESFLSGKMVARKSGCSSLLKILEGLVLILPPAALKDLPFPWRLNLCFTFDPQLAKPSG